jgi:Bacterial CdiA-CT RNAse A domain
MADIYYLKPSAKQAANANALQPGRNHPGVLSVVLSLSQLAAVILKDSIMIDQAVSPRLLDMIGNLQQSSDRTLSGGNGPATGLATGHSASSSAAKRMSTAGMSAGSARAVSDELIAAGKLDAVVAEGVAAGNIRLGSQQRVYGSHGSSLPAAVKMLADHVGVPPDILVARQNRTQKAAFSFTSLSAVESALNAIFRNNTMMIQGWAERGGRPPLHLRLQGKEPFGMIAHAGAEEVTELRGIAVALEMERAGAGQCVKISMSVNAPVKR